jgi:hypothetical protein
VKASARDIVEFVAVEVPNLKGTAGSRPADLMDNAVVVKPLVRDNEGRSNEGRRRLSQVRCVEQKMKICLLGHEW